MDYHGDGGGGRKKERERDPSMIEEPDQNIDVERNFVNVCETDRPKAPCWCFKFYSPSSMRKKRDAHRHRGQKRNR